MYISKTIVVKGYDPDNPQAPRSFQFIQELQNKLEIEFKNSLPHFQPNSSESSSQEKSNSPRYIIFYFYIFILKIYNRTRQRSLSQSTSIFKNYIGNK